jgi:excisionase family DNA binding protein
MRTDAQYEQDRMLSGGLDGIPVVAEMLDVSDATVRRIIQRGELPAIRVGQQIKVARTDLLAYVERQREPGA